MVNSSNFNLGTRPLASVPQVNSRNTGDFVIIARGNNVYRLPLSALMNLNALDDVTLTNLAFSDGLTYDGDRWRNSGLSGISVININDIGYDVILLAGQSNAVGRGVEYDVVFDNINSDRVYQFPSTGTFTDTIIPLSQPVQHPTPDPDNKIGFIYSFVRQYLRSIPNNRSVLIVPMAVGGTGFVNNRWGVGNDLYVNAITQANKTLNLPNSRLAAILWHQGESDAGNSTDVGNYAAKLDATLLGLRQGITGATTTPIILGELSPQWLDGNTNRINLNNIIKTTPDRISNTAVASSEGLDGNVGDIIHFNAESQRILGRRYFDRYLTLVSGLSGSPLNTSPPSITGTPSFGETLTVTNGSWTNNPDTFSYQWRRNGNIIDGAVANNYVLTVADLEKTITAVVTATNGVGSTSIITSIDVASPIVSLGATVHFDASVNSSFDLTGNLIDQWDNLASNEFHLIPTGDSLRPTKDNDPDGRPRVRFNGGQMLVSAYDKLSRSDALLTVFVCLRREGDTLGYLIHSDGTQNVGALQGLGVLYNLFQGEPAIPGFYTRVNLGGNENFIPRSVFGNDPHVLTIELNKAVPSGAFKVNDVTQTTDVGSTSSINAFSLGGRTPSSPAAFLTFDCYEFAIVEGTPDEAQSTLIADFLALKWQ